MHLKETGVYFGHCTLLHKTVTLPVNSHSITTSPLGIRSIKSRRRKTAIYHQWTNRRNINLTNNIIYFCYSKQFFLAASIVGCVCVYVSPISFNVVFICWNCYNLCRLYSWRWVEVKRMIESRSTKGRILYGKHFYYLKSWSE